MRGTGEVGTRRVRPTGTGGLLTRQVTGHSSRPSVCGPTVDRDDGRQPGGIEARRVVSRRRDTFVVSSPFLFRFSVLEVPGSR